MNNTTKLHKWNLFKYIYISIYKTSVIYLRILTYTWIFFSNKISTAWFRIESMRHSFPFSPKSGRVAFLRQHLPLLLKEDKGWIYWFITWRPRRGMPTELSSFSPLHAEVSILTRLCPNTKPTLCYIFGPVVSKINIILYIRIDSLLMSIFCLSHRKLFYLLFNGFAISFIQF